MADRQTRMQCTCVNSSGERCLRFQHPQSEHPYCAPCLDRSCELLGGNSTTGLFRHPSIGHVLETAEHVSSLLARSIGRMHGLLLDLGLSDKSKVIEQDSEDVPF